MADTIENNQTQTTQQVDPAAQQTQTPQQESREQVYQRLYGTNAAPPQQVQQTQQSTEPDYKALFTALAQEVSGLKQAMQQAAPVATAPVEQPGKWFAQLRDGDVPGAEQTLIDKVAKGAGEKITQDTLMQALELARTERTIEDYNSAVRAQNPDLLDVEDLVSLKAEQYFRYEMPKITSTKDYIDTYKRVVNQSVTDIRKLLQRTRAAAKNEAYTTQREVLASTTINPNDIGRHEEPGLQNNQQQSQPDTSPQSYLDMRRANADAKRNPYQAAARQTVGL